MRLHAAASRARPSRVAHATPVPGDRMAVVVAIAVTAEGYPVYAERVGWDSRRVHHFSQAHRSDDCEACAQGACVQRVEHFIGAKVIIHDQRRTMS